ncbi:hypothetical protein BDV39DRAFT_198020 [Aspergillus sergii]|uniref:Uncharacterized protein n=1 Tax=Aspergillus sergii TaxID=1034303 RepID=A0A5N6WJU9_9EURO|nr:hypothetical protein BDV39DRAFT_198020 [Aspergillus sergii]
MTQSSLFKLFYKVRPRHYHGPIGGTSREGALAQLGQVVSSEKRPVNACRKELTVSKNQDSFAGSADMAANQPVANLAGILVNQDPRRNKSNFCRLITFARGCQTFFNPTQ